ncbi:glycoside hydrolase family 6 protein [Streptomyces sp. NPDC048172]|uniref:glycoside hydrolase family 6 protein n=1 Tax=Streptomyces sp. NPDC048172 TaxID=3365505 RepID=UPI0037165D7D
MIGRRAGRAIRGGRGRFTAGAAAAGAALLLMTGCTSSGGGSEESKETDEGRGQGGGAKSAYWVNPDSNAAQAMRQHKERGEDKQAALVKKIAEQPVGTWILPEDPEGEARKVSKAAADAGQRALIVLYNIPHRDCGQYSQGGFETGEEYRAFVDKVAKGIGDRKATVVVEPDSIPHLLQEGCTPKKFHEERYDLLKGAVQRMKEQPRTKVYLDAGNPGWTRDPGALVEPLKRAGIDEADGFSLNVSNFETTKANVAYGKRLSPMIGNKPFVIDTSRNGNGPVKGGQDEEAWCNPRGRALGEKPTTDTGVKGVDAYLWIKRAGDSDGECQGGPKAGQWFTDRALELAKNARH